MQKVVYRNQVSSLFKEVNKTREKSLNVLRKKKINIKQIGIDPMSKNIK